MTRILLGQLGSNGDCLYATIVARQIKKDFPGITILDKRYGEADVAISMRAVENMLRVIMSSDS